MALHSQAHGSILPPLERKAYTLNANAALTAAYPYDGWGSNGAVSGSAIWAGLTAGTFEVVIESIFFRSNTTMVEITEIGGAPPEVFRFASASGFSLQFLDVKIACRDGFAVSSMGTDGCIITFRVHKYAQG